MSTVTIPAGEAVSTPLDLTSAAVTMVIAPADASQHHVPGLD
jgi:hypothetical protein